MKEKLVALRNFDDGQKIIDGKSVDWNVGEAYKGKGDIQGLKEKGLIGPEETLKAMKDKAKFDQMAISDLRKQVVSLEKEVEKLKASNQELTNQRDALKEELDSLEIEEEETK